MQKLLLANFKMNPARVQDAVRLARAIDQATKGKKVGVGVAPAFPHLAAIGKLKHAGLGAQDIFWENPTGAYTGEISAAMLKSVGASFVIVGHSERRKLGETDDAVNKKIKAAIKAGLNVALCVGEPLSVRKKGLKAAKRYVLGQLRKGLRGVPRKTKPRLVVAYEPIWAIGTGKADSPMLAADMAKFIKTRAGRDALYGGSVTAKNAKKFLQEKNINGALVGGASLHAKEFGSIIRIAHALSLD